METLSVNEDLALPWIVAEDEIRQMIENPDVLGDSQTDMLSGGRSYHRDMLSGVKSADMLKVS